MVSNGVSESFWDHIDQIMIVRAVKFVYFINWSTTTHIEFFFSVGFVRSLMKSIAISDQGVGGIAIGYKRIG